MYAESERPRSIWLRSERAGRGPAPGHDRAGIAAAAVGLADAGGLEAVSMRKVAGVIGAGATALYRYVDSRDELVQLMLDAVLADLRYPLLTGAWRADVLALARALDAVCREHPWTVDVLQGQPPMSPHGVVLLERALAALEPVDAPGQVKLEAVALTIGLVATVARTELAAGRSTEEWRSAQEEYLRSVVVAGEHPHLARAITTSTPASGDQDLLGRLLPRVLTGALGVTDA
ncbi:TetR/AcrR family transcriptional regulator C-terminal domain-containing protein [Isoptericola sp. NPDC019482]|uniref:TetR/AcrR family transcriptional regulator C-terminal domain-containing protein n=1 Tax=Isoptericola sp. NPDC019482 TaxID=3154688 RepID=UPI003497B43A